MRSVACASFLSLCLLIAACDKGQGSSAGTPAAPANSATAATTAPTQHATAAAAGSATAGVPATSAAHDAPAVADRAVIYIGVRSDGTINVYPSGPIKFEAVQTNEPSAAASVAKHAQATFPSAEAILLLIGDVPEARRAAVSKALDEAGVEAGFAVAADEP